VQLRGQDPRLGGRARPGQVAGDQEEVGTLAEVLEVRP